MILWTIKNIFTIIRHSIVMSILMYMSVCSALFLYMLFYNWYMPYAAYKRDVLFEIQTTRDGFTNTQQNELISIVNLFENSGDRLQPGQEYQIALLLALAESENNFETGKENLFQRNLIFLIFIVRLYK